MCGRGCLSPATPQSPSCRRWPGSSEHDGTTWSLGPHSDSEPRRSRSCTHRFQTGAGACAERRFSRAGSGDGAILEEALFPVGKVPHHGGRGASSPAWIAATRPCVDIVSAGRSNPFGHPVPDVRARYRAADALILETASHGAITLETDGRMVTMCTETGERFRFQARDDGCGATCSHPVALRLFHGMPLTLKGVGRGVVHRRMLFRETLLDGAETASEFAIRGSQDRLGLDLELASEIG